MSDRRPDPEPGGEGFLASASERALRAERRRLGLGEEAADGVEIWGRRIGRVLAWGFLAALLAWFLLAGGGRWPG